MTRTLYCPGEVPRSAHARPDQPRPDGKRSGNARPIPNPARLDRTTGDSLGDTIDGCHET